MPRTSTVPSYNVKCVQDCFQHCAIAIGHTQHPQRFSNHAPTDVAQGFIQGGGGELSLFAANFQHFWGHLRACKFPGGACPHTPLGGRGSTHIIFPHSCLFLDFGGNFLHGCKIKSGPGRPAYEVTPSDRH